VVLLLLIFFMLTTSFVEQPGMKLDLPETKSSSGEKPEGLEIEVQADGIISLNGETVTMEDLSDRLKNMIDQSSEKSLLLRADKEVPHGTVVEIMDIAKLNGLEKLIIGTKQVKNNK
ncbi:ExbD/TolR family protein, partial [Candidatus Cloacimonadota bacterium]